MSERNIVIVAYRPKPGKEADLIQLTREHLPVLRAEGLVTDRKVIACLTADGTVVEVFEWEAGGVEKAHANPQVLALWERYSTVCDYVPLNTVAESTQMFASFAPLDI
jgi:hypothetical protein